MRYGYCTGAEARDAWGVGIDAIAVAAAAGFDYVELPLAPLVRMPRADFETHVVGALEAAGIPCYACNSFFPADVRLTGPDASPAAITAYAEESIALAASLGTRVIVLGSGGARNLPDGYPEREGYRELAEALRLIGPIAAHHGVTIALEPLNRMESNLLNTYESGLFTAALSGQASVGTLVDAYHFAIGGEPLESLLLHAPAHVHVAQALGRLLPTAPGAPACRAFLAALAQTGYDAAISLEGNTRGDFAAHLAASLAFMKGIIDG